MKDGTGDWGEGEFGQEERKRLSSMPRNRLVLEASRKRPWKRGTRGEKGDAQSRCRPRKEEARTRKKRFQLSHWLEGNGRINNKTSEPHQGEDSYRKRKGGPRGRTRVGKKRDDLGGSACTKTLLLRPHQETRTRRWKRGRKRKILDGRALKLGEVADDF